MSRIGCLRNIRYYNEALVEAIELGFDICEKTRKLLRFFIHFFLIIEKEIGLPGRISIV